ncbi:MAG: 6-pyruvoyl trahydropterin synthase family protein [Planctomycetia bacterium]
MIVRRDFHFEASHQLPNHPGRCRRLHGHGYRLRVACRAPVNPLTGIAIDFGDLKALVRTHVIEALDHTHLNDLLALPSAEHIVAWIWERLAAQGLPLCELTLWESPGCSVTYHGPAHEPPPGPGRG